jgi:hypothetical protein
MMRVSIRYGLLAVSIIALSACGASRKTVETVSTMPPAVVKTMEGAWQILVADTPMGDVAGELVLEKNETGYASYVVFSGEKMNVRNLKVSEKEISGSFYSGNVGADIYFNSAWKEDTDTLEGWVMDSYKMTGKRKADP